MDKKWSLLFLTAAILAAAIVLLTACGGSTPAPTAAPTEAVTATDAATEAGTEATEEVARPSNEGGPGAAVGLTGDVANGKTLYVANCQKCHGPDGTGGVVNPGSADGTVPPLNPIDSTLIDKSPKVYATNLDLFLEHGSNPEADSGKTPALNMPAWGDGPVAPYKKLTPQEIADVIAYVMSLNPAN